MIIGLWHPGSGLGDQLFCYLAARITAERLGVPLTMVGLFKGENFIAMDKGHLVEIPHHVEYPTGKIVIDNRFPLYEGKKWYDPEFNFIEDNTIVDGCMVQDQRYWENFPVKEWLSVSLLDIQDDVCVIGFRGGEYALFPELFLSKEYWSKAIDKMKRTYWNMPMKFEIHTDDARLALDFFADLLEPQEIRVIHNIDLNWRSVRFAQHLIISNSAFYILPSLLNEGVKEVIAPKGWARHNLGKGHWEMPANYYSKFTYL